MTKPWLETQARNYPRKRVNSSEGVGCNMVNSFDPGGPRLNQPQACFVNCMSDIGGMAACYATGGVAGGLARSLQAYSVVGSACHSWRVAWCNVEGGSTSTEETESCPIE